MAHQGEWAEGAENHGRLRLGLPAQAGRRAIEELLELRFVERHEDVLVTGKSGTGKSHILQALALEACGRELMVRYSRCVDLIDDLYAGLADGSYERRMKRWCRPALLVWTT